MNNFNITIDSKEVRTAFAKAPQKVAKGLNDWVKRSALRTERQEKKEAPVDKGGLQSSIRTEFGKLTATVAPHKDYAVPVEQGTGLYGPKKRRIFAKRKVMVFEVQGATIFTRSIKGQKPNPFVERTHKKVKPEIENDAAKTLDSIVRSI